jgi:hypothetical protein
LTWHKGQSAKNISAIDSNEMTGTGFLMQKDGAGIECRA